MLWIQHLYDLPERVMLDLFALAIHDVPVQPSFMRIGALLLRVHMPPDPTMPSSPIRPFHLASLKSAVEQLPALRLVVLWFSGDISLVESVADMNPAICGPLSLTRDVTYRFLCHPPPANASDNPHVYNSMQSWIEIDPTTLVPTGMRSRQFDWHSVQH